MSWFSATKSNSVDKRNLGSAAMASQVAAINQSQAVMEFSTEGRIVHANANFLNALGYALDEIRGQHHSLFVEPAYRDGLEYRAFWQKLGRGEFDAGQYKRITKGGREIWIQASYNPLRDRSGTVTGVIAFATDISAEKRRNADFEGQMAALHKAQAIIEFDLDGIILTANENFLNTLGYSLSEIKGQHHSMFVEPGYRQSPEYRMFWEKLGRGEFDAGQYKRIAKGGREVWIQASYNPILDASGRPFKVVKFASDITAMRMAVEQTREAVEAAKQKDLTHRIPMTGKTGELAVLCGGVNELLDSMADVMGEIKATSQEVASAAAEISSATTDLSQRTEEQAASLEETSASMEEIAATVRKNAENAKHANDLTRGSHEVADRGGEVVAQAVCAMARIEESSRKIADIISVIDEIARQTNLLALNAAVEAARAGEAGRGFAVVAAEVRSLAQRSSQAAKDIKDLITSSSSQVQDGVQLVNRAGNSLKEILESIKQVADIVADIATASTEQAGGIEQINKALNQMDEVTQQNSAMVEENAATARTLEQQAGEMDARMAAYRLGKAEDTPRGTVPQRIAAPAKVSDMASSPVRMKPKRPALRGGGRPVRTALATAISQDEWEEF
ncbi:methyl-accepting chemotaxis protein [Pseudorhodoplanes sp.]|uniref:methyl-accepting chemotaxis protein n=1 Tax=Pseudorhodoplanes sp. TaxID=1934341 RepID=UPI003D0CC2E1